MNFRKAFDHLKSDKVMSFLILKFGKIITIEDRYEKNYAKAISLLIIEQQVSFKAAITIKKRFNKLINKKTNKDILNIKDEKMQSIGISKRKVKYIKNTFNYFEEKKIEFEKLEDYKIIEELVKIKGVGMWTSQMFLIFIMFRLNIFSKGDLALINSVKKNYGIEKLDDFRLETLTKKWEPYKTIASLLLWKSIENQVFFSKK
ncbi:MAG: DNA-3-methyladenine glycosylase 2 family protein [Flavobacteriaceae bacterium]|nr:DNA-3-methyladenine glycosylase 2 family protein [Flavobacteriaceae bacterium]